MEDLDSLSDGAGGATPNGGWRGGETVEGRHQVGILHHIGRWALVVVDGSLPVMSVLAREGGSTVMIGWCFMAQWPRLVDIPRLWYLPSKADTRQAGRPAAAMRCGLRATFYPSCQSGPRTDVV